MNRGRIAIIVSCVIWGVVVLAAASYVAAFRSEPRLKSPKSLSELKGKELQRSTRPGSAYPVTVVLQEIIIRADGQRVVGGKYTKAVRSDGSNVQIMESLNPQSTVQTLQRVITLASGVRSILSDVRQTKTTEQHQVTNILGRYMDPASECLRPYSAAPIIGDSPVLLGTEQLHGYRVHVTRRGGNTHWLAPELGCATLKIRMEYGDGEASEQDAILISPGEPDPTLFAIPNEYVELPPSQFYRMDPNSSDARRRDELYHSRRLASAGSD